MPRQSSKGTKAGGLRLYSASNQINSSTMKYVYILASLEGGHFYIGVTGDLKARLEQRNSGAVSHTAKFRPWQIKTYIAFLEETKAFQFERYLKSGSGRAFAKAHL